MSELHFKIWTREDQRSELFRETNIIVGHYVESQKLLTALHSSRDSGVARDNVQSVKFDMLSSFEHPLPISAPAVPPGPTDDDQVGVGQTRIRTMVVVSMTHFSLCPNFTAFQTSLLTILPFSKKSLRTHPT
jgi:hypothetical protein